jgi:hypothetical protein
VVGQPGSGIKEMISMSSIKSRLARLFSSAEPRAKKPIGVGLVTVLTALGVLGVSATSAWATEVLPANTAITATLKSGTMSAFYPANAYAETSLRCKASTAKFKTPTGGLNPEAGEFNNNKNRGPNEGVPSPVGTFSTGPGSVIADLTEPPSFSECGVYAWTGSSWAEVEGATVATNADNGNWSVAAVGMPSEGNELGAAAIAVPKAGAEITSPAGLKIVVSPTEASSVTALYNNVSSTLSVDGQLNFSSNAELPPPAQFEATYIANNGLEILP